MLRVVLLLLSMLWLSAHAAIAEDDCVGCHRDKSPGAVRQWQQSAHFGKVDCAGCHGSDHVAIEEGRARVSSLSCQPCHQKAYNEHARSKHGLGLHSGWGCTRNLPQRDPQECRFCHDEGNSLPKSRVQCARFLKQSSAMGEIGCNRCHQVESSCASCHTNHLTDLAVVRNPNVCAKCHMGPDHPQWEMWQTSQHGTLYESLGPEVGPGCQRCHMSSGNHDVSRGVTLTPAGTPVAEGLVPTRRAQMLQICTECHAYGFAEREMLRADAVLQQSRDLVAEADAIVWDLYDRSRLAPMPEQRPEHPLRGPVLVTDGQMLYEDTSHIERLLFKMKKFDFSKTWKGAYHQNPAYAHWYGNAELKMDLVDIRSEALRLGTTEPPARDAEEEGTLEEALQVLQRKLKRGALSAQEYMKQKQHLLEEEFLSPTGADGK